MLYNLGKLIQYMYKTRIFLLSLLILCIFTAGCGKSEHIWNMGIYPDFDDGFSTSISEEASNIMQPLLDALKKEGVPDSDNEVVVDYCRFYGISDDEGYYIKYYRQIMANDSRYFEVYYYKNEPILIDSSFDIKYSTAICDGEKLYYVNSDGFLLCADKNSDIKKIPAFSGSVNVGFITFKGENNNLSIISISDSGENETVTIDADSIK